MKINTTIWFGIIITSSLIIFFKNCDFQLQRKYLINRVFEEPIIRQTENTFIQSLDNTSIFTDKLICSYTIEKADENSDNCTVNYFNINDFSKSDSFSFLLPNTAQIKFCQPDAIYFIDQFVLSAYYPSTRKTQKITSPNFKCINVTDVNNHKLLLLGEDKDSLRYKTGYFTIVPNTEKPELVKLLEENNNSTAAPNSLIYSGKFTRLDTGICSYYCDKYAKVFFFDNQGKFIREFTTKDNAPKPELVTNGLAFFYKRGNTFNVNNAIIKADNKLMVFSCRSNPVSYIMVDNYSFEDGRYLSSAKLNYKDWTCQDIISISKSKNNLIVNFQNGVRLFTL